MSRIPVTEAPVFSRDFADLEIRADGTGRTLAGIVVPYERTAMVSDGGPSYAEAFRMGAFAKTIQERSGAVKLLSQHERSKNPIGVATSLREDTAGLYGEFKVSQTRDGEDALALARDGALDSFSVGFAPIAHVREGKTTVRTEVHLREVSLVTFPAYADARISAIRAMEAAGLDPEEVAEYLAQKLRSATLQEPVELGTPTGAATVEEPQQHSARQLRIAMNKIMAELEGIHTS